MGTYLLVRRVLFSRNRDIVPIFCQYGMGHVSAQGEKAEPVPEKDRGHDPYLVNMTSIPDVRDGLELFDGPEA